MRHLLSACSQNFVMRSKFDSSLGGFGGGDLDFDFGGERFKMCLDLRFKSYSDFFGSGCC